MSPPKITPQTEIQAHNTIQFDRYTINKQYEVYRMENGRNIKVLDKELVKQILKGDYLTGSLGITIDRKRLIKMDWIHKLILVIQKGHSFFTRRRRDFDPHHCHSFIVTGAGVKPNAERPNPLLIAHASWAGIKTANRDYLQSKDVSSVVFYRPRDSQLRESIVDQAKRTTYIDDKDLRELSPESAEKKAGFRILDAFTSIFHNSKHKVCQKKGKCSRPSNAVSKRAAYQIADLLLSKQVLDNKGRPKSLYCSAYAMYVFQRGLVNHLLSGVDKEKKEAFMKSNNGELLSRKKLAKKLHLALKGKGSCEYSNHIYDAYTKQKLARLDARYIMSGYVAKTFNKYS